jgi:ABC-type branched-subunit amino acid transport system substrate-binding protein
MKNRMGNQRTAWITILAVTLTALLLFTACAPAPSAEKEKVVEIAMIAPFTGGPATMIQYAYRNLVDYLRYFEEVGIPGTSIQPGVSIRLLWGDSAFDPTKAISAYERMMEHNIVVFYLPSPVAAEGLQSRLQRDDVPAFTMSLNEALMYPPGPIFAVYPTESERFAVLCDWIIANWQEERPPRVAIMGTDTPSGRAPEVMGTKYAQSKGIEMLPFEVVPYLPLDTTSQLLRLRDEEADFVYLAAIWTTAIPILRDAERLGLTDKIRFGGMENSQSIPMIEALGPSAEGYFATRAAPWYEEVPILTDMYMRYEGKIDTGGDGAATVLFASAMIEAIRIAIDNVGYENLDGRAVKEAWESIKDFDPLGIKKLTYSPEDHRGSAAIRIYEVQGGRVVIVSDWQDAPMLVPEG